MPRSQETTRWKFCLVLAIHVAWCPFTAVAELTASGLHGGSTQSVATSKFVYYGSTIDSEIPPTRAFFLPQMKACVEHPERWIQSQRLAIIGRVVFTDWYAGSRIMCDREKLYDALVQSGAIVFVQLGILDPPGSLSWYHQSWRPERVNKRLQALTIVEVYKYEADIDAWKAAADELRISIRPPHSEAWHRFYESVQFIVLVRIVLPAMYLWVSYVALVYGHRISVIRRENIDPNKADVYLAGIVICALQGLTSFVTGVNIILGSADRHMLPWMYHLVMNEALATAYLFTTLLLNLLLQYQARQQYLQYRQPFWALYRVRIIFFAGLCLSLTVMIHIESYNTKLDFGIYGIAVGCLFLIVLITSLSFLYNAYKLSAPVLRHLRKKTKLDSKFAPSPAELIRYRNIYRLTMSMATNGITMLILVIFWLYLMVSTVRGSSSRNPPIYPLDLLLILAVVIINMFRILNSYCHIRCVKPYDNGNKYFCCSSANKVIPSEEEGADRNATPNKPMSLTSFVVTQSKKAVDLKSGMFCEWEFCDEPSEADKQTISELSFDTNSSGGRGVLESKQIFAE